MRSDLDRFALIGSSKGGPTSIAYAARHPERVSHLILYGTFAQGWRVKGNDAVIERGEALIALMRPAILPGRGSSPRCAISWARVHERPTLPTAWSDV